MLQRLVLQNFQCHERLMIDLDPSITCLLGRSDVGKSSIVRALYWLTFNRPSGSAFTRSGSDRGVEVALDTKAGTVARFRGGAQGNGYRIGGKSKKPLRAFGTDVPEPVTALLNLGPVNFQLQHSPPFWLALSPAEASRALNEVVDLGLIDRTLAALAKEKRQAQADVDAARTRYKEARTYCNQSAWVRAANVKLRKIERMSQSVEEERLRLLRIDDLLSEARTLAREKKSCLREAQEAERALREGEGLAAVLEKVEKTQALLDEYRRLEEELCDAEKAERTAERELAQIKNCPMCRQPLPSSRLSARISTGR